MRIEEIYQCYLQCDSVSIDTRKIQPNSLFVALKGDNFDANSFASEALTKGALFAIIDNKQYFTDENKMLLVNDSLETLQQLANYHRKQLGLPIVALTGSNGKTTTKELINAVLSKKYNTKATIGNLNNHIGVPLTLLSFNENTDIGIVEMGANHQNEIQALCNIAEPDYGYITNFGKAHLEGFGGLEGVIKGKSEMYDFLNQNHKTIFVNLDDPIQNEKTKLSNRFTFSLKEEADVVVKHIESTPMVRIDVNDNFSVQSNLIGYYNANNINAAITIGKYFNVDDDDIKKAIESYVPANNRSQLIDKDSNTIILDAYNANPSSMTVALENFKNLKSDNKIAILGDMFELGVESLNEHRSLVDSVKSNGDIKFYFIGKDFNKIKNNELNQYFFESFEDFKNNFEKPEKALILIKGSRGMSLERCLDII